jgi:hypothetical protein
LSTSGAAPNVRFRAGEVEMLSVGRVKAPYTGYTVEKVRVEFRAPARELEVGVRVSAGSLQVDERLDE